ncbi:MAG: MlaD family protein [Balneolaceae bacterium]
MTNELKTGLTVVAAVVIAYLGFRFMSDVPIFRSPMEVVTRFDRVDGLGSGGLVYMQGVKIGSVNEMALTPEGDVRVVMSIEMDLQIPVDSRAQLTSQGFLDGKSIVIEKGQSDRVLTYGEEIEGIYVDSIMETLGSRGQELGDDFSDTFEELNQFLVQLNHTLDDESSRSVRETIQSLEMAVSTLSGVLDSRKRELDETIGSLHHLMAELDTTATETRPNIERVMQNLEVSSDDIRKISSQLDRTVENLNGILEKVNRGEGSLGRMVNDPSLYENVDSLSVEMKNLIRSIQENPGQYLRHMKMIEIF